MNIDADDLEEIAEPQPDDPSRHFLIYCDESGIDGGTVFGFGSLWMPWERRGDFMQIWRRLHEEHFPPSEVKWTKVKTKILPFFEALVDEFFQRNWLMFHCLLIGRRQVDLNYHQHSWDLAHRKHFVMLLANKIKRFAAPGKQYRIRVDPLPSSYGKADEAAEIILRRMLNEEVGLKGLDVIHSPAPPTRSPNGSCRYMRSACIFAAIPRSSYARRGSTRCAGNSTRSRSTARPSARYSTTTTISGLVSGFSATFGISYTRDHAWIVG